MIAALIQGVFSLVVAYYAVYALLELRMVLLARRCEKARLTELDSVGARLAQGAGLPTVSVLLPVYNESLVVEGLIDAVCLLHYPAGRIEILVLDDSTDETTTLAAGCVFEHAARGVDVRLVRRDDRSGFKAGNLINGIRVAKGDFLAIFDADFLPQRDFLLRTIPCFDDPQVGFLQTGIGYTNRDASFLTRFQAMEMGHQQFVTVGLHHDGLMGSLSGSSCIWRRACVESIGGWSADTITEDVDLGYRAQLQRWKYAFLRDVVSLSELPETISAFRVQRDRWARGLIHNAFRHLGSMLATRMSIVERLHAVSMMFSSLLLSSFFLLILLSLPLALIADELGAFFEANCVLFLVTVLVWAFGNAFGSQQGARLSSDDPLWKRGVQLYAYVAMFLPMSLYYFSAGVQVLAGVQGGFHRTPKGGGKEGPDVPAINHVLATLEWLTIGYSAAALVAAISNGNYWIVPFSGTACAGFAMVIIFAHREQQSRKPRTSA